MMILCLLYDDTLLLYDDTLSLYDDTSLLYDDTFFINRKLGSFLCHLQIKPQDILNFQYLPQEPYKYPGFTSRNPSQIKPLDHGRNTVYCYLQKWARTIWFSGTEFCISVRFFSRALPDNFCLIQFIYIQENVRKFCWQIIFFILSKNWVK